MTSSESPKRSRGVRMSKSSYVRESTFGKDAFRENSSRRVDVREVAESAKRTAAFSKYVSMMDCMNASSRWLQYHRQT